MEDGSTAGAQITTDRKGGSARINALDDARYPHRRLTGEVIGGFYEVYNALRWGLPESAYAGALEIELGDRGIAYRREARLDVWYKDRIAGHYRADCLVEGRLILEPKATSAIGDTERRQLLKLSPHHAYTIGTSASLGG